jgi:hypothetical protein
MLKTKGQETADDLTGAQTAVPEGKSWSLFRLSVPSTADEDQGGNNTSLEYPEEDTGCEQTPVVFGSRS